MKTVLSEQQKLAKLATLAISEIVSKLRNLIKELDRDSRWIEPLQSWTDIFEDNVLNFLNPNKSTPLPTDKFLNNSGKSERLAFYIDHEVQGLAELRLYEKENGEILHENPEMLLAKNVQQLKTKIISCQSETVAILKYYLSPEENGTPQMPLSYWPSRADLSLPKGRNETMSEAYGIHRAILEMKGHSQYVMTDDDSDHIKYHQALLEQLFSIYADYGNRAAGVISIEPPASVEILTSSAIDKIAVIEGRKQVPAAAR